MSSNEIDYEISSQLICEFLGSMFLVMAAISPIILFHNIMGTSIGIAVIADALAVGFILFVLIEMFAPISGAHFNPAVSLAMVLGSKMKGEQTIYYMATQVFGGLMGMLASHLMFYHEIPQIMAISDFSRPGGNYLAELFGTFLLVLAILIMISNRSNRISLAVGILFGGMLLATSSTMFANPQVTFARMFTYSAASSSPSNAFVFVIMEAFGAALAVFVWCKIFSAQCYLFRKIGTYKLR